jgi:ribonucleoside-diphosphate reductase alpha chain
MWYGTSSWPPTVIGKEIFIMSKEPRDYYPSLSSNAITVLEKRYLRKNQGGDVLETPDDMFRRVAATIAAAERAFDPAADTDTLTDLFLEAMARLEFLPNSPTLMNAGRELGQLSACFVLPVGDSMEEIFDAVKYTALIHKSGGGTGFSFSRLRPANDLVRTTTGTSSGPISFMRVFDAATEAIKQGGTRRGANMGILRVDHPDILAFIECKAGQKGFNNFNISVGLTEDFMRAVEADESYPLVNPRNGEITGHLGARAVFHRIVEQAWSNGEPGIVFLDRLNRDNPTPREGMIESTNPCGEQPLLPFESCNLGSVNLGRMVREGDVDWEKLGRTTRLGVRFLDNVIEVNRYPLERIGEMTRANRKIGLGVMGWADMLIELGIPYDAPEAIELGEKVMAFIREEGHATSRELGAARGSFPNFPGSVFDRPGAAPMRNATVTTIAPTGTISIIAGASSGIEPLFAVSFVRNVLDNNTLVEVNPIFERLSRERGFHSEDLLRSIASHGTVRDNPDVPEDVRRLFATAHDISPEVHIRMQAAFQRHTDNAVSKTVNFPNGATLEDVRKVYRLAYELGCKGVTIYRDGSRDRQVLSTGGPGEETEGPPPRHPSKRERPRTLTGSTYQMHTGCGALYVTINEDEAGLFELFTTMGKAGGCAASQCEAIGRMVSLSWRSGVPAGAVVKQLVGISCHLPWGFGESKVLSCADAVAKAIEEHMRRRGIADEPAERKPVPRGACPECGGTVEHEGGCWVCRACGFSECA